MELVYPAVDPRGTLARVIPDAEWWSLSWFAGFLPVVVWAPA